MYLSQLCQVFDRVFPDPGCDLWVMNGLLSDDDGFLDAALHYVVHRSAARLLTAGPLSDSSPDLSEEERIGAGEGSSEEESPRISEQSAGPCSSDGTRPNTTTTSSSTTSTSNPPGAHYSGGGASSSSDDPPLDPDRGYGDGTRQTVARGVDIHPHWTKTDSLMFDQLVRLLHASLLEATKISACDDGPASPSQGQEPHHGVLAPATGKLERRLRFLLNALYFELLRFGNHAAVFVERDLEARVLGFQGLADRDLGRRASAGSWWW